MKTNEHSIEEEATWLLEYEVPELKEIIVGLAFGGMGTGGDQEVANSGDIDGIFGADDETEENGTFSLDD